MHDEIWFWQKNNIFLRITLSPAACPPLSSTVFIMLALVVPLKCTKIALTLTRLFYIVILVALKWHFVVLLSICNFNMPHNVNITIKRYRYRCYSAAIGIIITIIVLMLWYIIWFINGIQVRVSHIKWPDYCWHHFSACEQLLSALKQCATEYIHRTMCVRVHSYNYCYN